MASIDPARAFDNADYELMDFAETLSKSAQQDGSWVHVTGVTLHGADRQTYPNATFKVVAPNGDILTVEVRRGDS